MSIRERIDTGKPGVLTVRLCLEGTMLLLEQGERTLLLPVAQVPEFVAALRVVAASAPEPL